MRYRERVARNNQMMKTRLANKGRVAGTGVESDRYDEDSFPHTKDKTYTETYMHRSGCTLPFELTSGDPYYNEDWEKVKEVLRERKRKAKEARAS